MISFKFDDKLLIHPEFYIKYYGTIDLSAEIYFNENLIGKVKSEFLNSASKEFEQFLIDNEFDLVDQEDFFTLLIKFNQSFKDFKEELYHLCLVNMVVELQDIDKLGILNNVFKNNLITDKNTRNNIKYKKKTIGDIHLI